MHWYLDDEGDDKEVQYGRPGSALQLVLHELMDVLPKAVGRQAATIFKWWESGMSIAEIVARTGLTGDMVRHNIERVDKRIIRRITGERLAILLGLGVEFPGERSIEDVVNHVSDFHQEIRKDAGASGVAVVSDFRRWLEEQDVYMAQQEAKPKPQTHDDDPKMSTDLFSLGLSTRAINGLAVCGVKTLADICALTAWDIMKVRGMGEKTFTEIEKMLAGRGLGLNK